MKDSAPSGFKQTITSNTFQNQKVFVSLVKFPPNTTALFDLIMHNWLFISAKMLKKTFFAIVSCILIKLLFENFIL